MNNSRIKLFRFNEPSQITRAGFKRNLLSDIYHFLLTVSWPKFFLIFVLFFLVLNSLFALAYLAGGNVIENARFYSFSDAFFFSVQTLATIGYGKMTPVGFYANILVTFEVFIGLMSLTLATGLSFAKFSRPTARIIFSKDAVISPQNHLPCLMFRMANERTNQIVHANLKLNILRNEITMEGQTLRRFYGMKLLRDSTPVFGLTWLAIHPIDAESPLFGQTLESLKSLNAEIVVSFSGTDDTFLQTVYTQHSYLPDDILWGATFEDVLEEMSNGARKIHYEKFHATRKIS